jgi:23S rRNA pseudouridine1911/1915/1917 synthase
MQTIINFDEEPVRLDVFIAKNLHGISREFAKKLICQGRITVNGFLQKSSYHLSTGDRIKIDIPQIVEQKDLLKDILLYEDKDIMVISKPSGICVHPNDSNWEKFPDCLVVAGTSVVSIVYKERPEIFISGARRMGLVHRLDRNTSGVMVISKNKDSQKKIEQQFKEKTVEKVYAGVVSGDFQEKKGRSENLHTPTGRRDAPPPLKQIGTGGRHTGVPPYHWDSVAPLAPRQKGCHGRINLPIGRPTGSPKIKVWKYGKHSRTEFRVVSKTPKYTLLEIYPVTGRTNQIRVHFSYIGHPVVGDKLYGGEPALRLMLHSKKLSFIHPGTGRPVCFKSPLPEDFIKEWNRLKHEV